MWHHRPGQNEAKYVVTYWSRPFYPLSAIESFWLAPLTCISLLHNISMRFIYAHVHLRTYASIGEQTIITQQIIETIRQHQLKASVKSVINYRECRLIYGGKMKGPSASSAMRVNFIELCGASGRSETYPRLCTHESQNDPISAVLQMTIIKIDLETFKGWSNKYICITKKFATGGRQCGTRARSVWACGILPKRIDICRRKKKVQRCVNMYWNSYRTVTYMNIV